MYTKQRSKHIYTHSYTTKYILFYVMSSKSHAKSDLNLNSLLVKRQIDNPSPGAVTGGN